MIDQHIPAAREIYGWIEEIFRQGVRRPGYPADVWAEAHCLERFRAFGLEHVRAEPVELPYWEPRAATLTVRPASNADAVEIACFPLPHAAPARSLELTLRAFDRGAPSAVAGAAALYDVPLLRTPHAFFTRMATSVYDPDGGFETSTHVLPFGREIQSVMEPAIAAGAAAFIGVLSGYPGDSRDYYVPYDGVERALPGVWISGSDGARLREMLRAVSARSGDVRVTLDIDTERRPVTSYNIVGELPGADEEAVIIGSHHDGPWASAVEDASGMALVFAQAAYWSRVPREDRPHRLVFLLNAGHMCGGAGARVFCAQHREELERTVLELHLEHAALEFAERDGGPPISTGMPEARWWFTSKSARLESAVADAIAAEDLRRSIVLPPTALGERPTTDGSEFYLYGVPIVNLLAAPFYLFDAMDTMDKIDRASLVPITRAAVRIVESTAGANAAEMRA